MKTLVLGGYGNFGARICRALAGDTRIALVVCGRDLQKGEALARRLGGAATALRIDAGAGDLAGQLRAAGAELVIHTAGPFQAQGYAVARAAAAAGAHYIDLADGRRFVCDFPQAVGDAFIAAGRTAISGASTVPALSSAVVEALAAGWQRIDSIDTCIAPAQTAPRGLATMAGVLSYCGEALQVWEGGRWQVRHGWAEPEPVTFHRLKPRRGAPCDIPDLELFPARYAVRDRVMFRAAVELGFAQRVFAGLAAMRVQCVLSRPERLAGLLTRTAPWMDFLGSALGGMVVRVAGLDSDGRAVQRAWHIAAGDDHGPEIPCMAAILLARRLAGGDALPAGAMTAAGLLTLGAFSPEFTRWGMLTDVVDEPLPATGADVR